MLRRIKGPSGKCYCWMDGSNEHRMYQSFWKALLGVCSPSLMAFTDRETRKQMYEVGCRLLSK